MKCEQSRKKAQSEIMEYIFMVVLIVGAVIVILIFLTWWNITQMEMQGYKNNEERAIAIAKNIMGDYLFTNGESLLDDAKLTSLKAVSACGKLQGIFGSNWYAKIKSLDMQGETVCTWSSYPDCNYWEICNKKENAIGIFAINFPVNVYRKVSDKVALAVLRVEVYS